MVIMMSGLKYSLPRTSPLHHTTRGQDVKSPFLSEKTATGHELVLPRGHPHLNSVVPNPSGQLGEQLLILVTRKPLASKFPNPVSGVGDG